jgi:hypothetical protein
MQHSRRGTTAARSLHRLSCAQHSRDGTSKGDCPGSAGSCLPASDAIRRLIEPCPTQGLSASTEARNRLNHPQTLHFLLHPRAP